MRRPTYFVDIDGTIVVSRSSSATKQWRIGLSLAPGVEEWFDAAEKEGACIVLVTARRESYRPWLEESLRQLGLFWDHLVMGCGNGVRVLINDRKNAEETAVAINVTRNEGLDHERHIAGWRGGEQATEQGAAAAPR